MHKIMSKELTNTVKLPSSVNQIRKIKQYFLFVDERKQIVIFWTVYVQSYFTCYINLNRTGAIISSVS